MNQTNYILIIIILVASSCAKKVTSSGSQQNELFDGKNPLILLDETVINKEILGTLDKDDISKIEVFRGESAIAKFGEKASEGAVNIYTKSYTAKKRQELYKKLQDYLKNATGNSGDFLFVLDGILIDETNLDKLVELNYSEIEIVEQISEAAAKTIYGDKAKPNTILVTTHKMAKKDK